MKRKWMFRGVAGLFGLVIIALLVAVLMINHIAKAGVERGSEYALGVPTSLEDIDVRLLRSEVQLNGLNISNPEGYSSPHLLHSGQFDLGVEGGTLMSDKVVVRHFVIDGLDINIEQKLAGSNISKILDNLKRFESGEKKPPESRKTFVVNEVLIRNVTANFYLASDIPGMEEKNVTVTIPEIKLTDVSSEDKGVVLGELIRRILPAILEAVVQEGGDLLPADFRQSLDQQLTGLNEALETNLNEIVESVDSSGTRIREGLDNLFQSGEEPEE